VDPSEMKLLADIEKLTKKALIRIPLPSGSTKTNSAPQDQTDPFFYLPYESNQTSSPITVESATKSIVKAPSSAKALGALLGGSKKS
jgi:hypothetical protein